MLDAPCPAPADARRTAPYTPPSLVEHRRRVEALFDAALDLEDVAERETWLAGACVDDPELLAALGRAHDAPARGRARPVTWSGGSSPSGRSWRRSSTRTSRGCWTAA